MGGLASGVHHKGFLYKNTMITSNYSNSNSKSAKSRMVASLQGSMGTGKKEDESSTGCIWAGGFHHVMARSRLARVFKLMDHSFV